MKWLLGPMGTGFLYVNKNILDKLNIYHVGWLSVELDDLSSLYPVKPLAKNARRFESANFNLIGLYGLIESLTLLNTIGIHKIEEIILSKTAQFIEKLKNQNCEVLTNAEDRNRAGIVSFRKRRNDSKDLFKKITNENIVCSLREGWIRIAIHFFNTEEELDKVIKIISN